MKCVKCGAELEIGAKFCDNCGSRVLTNAAEATVVAEAAPAAVSDPGRADTKKVYKHKTSPGPRTVPILIAAVAVLAIALISAVIIIVIKPGSNAKEEQVREAAEDIYESETVVIDTAAIEETEAQELQEETYEEEAEVIPDSPEEPAEEEIPQEEEEEPEPPSYEEGIHQYEITMADCTWEEAYYACIEAGGHLVTLETDEEFAYVKDLLNNSDGVVYYLGGRYDEDGYYWIAPENVNREVRLDDRPEWLSGEPSYEDENGVSEEYMCMLHLKSEDRWVWNDVPNDVISVAPNYEGILGYICEYE